MDIIERIKRQIADASPDHKKAAMFHYSVLVNASELQGVDPVEFCRDVGVQDSYATEFRKMIKLAELIGHMGMKIGQR